MASLYDLWSRYAPLFFGACLFIVWDGLGRFGEVGWFSLRVFGKVVSVFAGNTRSLPFASFQPFSPLMAFSEHQGRRSEQKQTGVDDGA